MVVTSALIPQAAVIHRIRGEWTFRSARRDPPLAVLLDRDDTIIEEHMAAVTMADEIETPGEGQVLVRVRA